MATIARSKSCSFIPQDLPISELFSDIEEISKKILNLNVQVDSVFRHLQYLSSIERSIERSMERSIARSINSLEDKITTLNSKIAILEIAQIQNELQINQNTQNIEKLNKNLQELSSKVDRLIQAKLL